VRAEPLKIKAFLSLPKEGFWLSKVQVLNQLYSTPRASTNSITINMPAPIGITIKTHAENKMERKSSPKMLNGKNETPKNDTKIAVKTPVAAILKYVFLIQPVLFFQNSC
jgi:hypothetical protein